MNDIDFPAVTSGFTELIAPANNAKFAIIGALKSVTTVEKQKNSKLTELTIKDGMDALRDSVQVSYEHSKKPHSHKRQATETDELQEKLIRQMQIEYDELAKYDLNFLRTQPLWRQAHFNSQNLNHCFQVGAAQLTSWGNQETSPWSFWKDWYQRTLDGEPLAWELQQRIAQIDETIWKAGVEPTAKEIKRTLHLYQLEQEITKLKRTLTTQTGDTTTYNLGDNGGPPLDDEAERAIQTDLALIWMHVDELEAEAAKPEPSRDTLEKLAKWFQDLLAKATAYFGSKADIVLTKSAEVTGTVGTTATIAYLTASSAAQNEGLKGLVEAIWNFAKTLPPG
ncbi:hypothetical protein [Leisingera sp. ANG-S5]|uniref:hypothetical protein n=1 Tax=Leisingera sp. ANG-S5 TaxID=1577901 RepID=UPI00057FA7E4|nr:hypothetical protein [Leisingera sp. ANG-S5]KIC34310.1 hypothetical protein RA25_00415 [Leisingera sp. ANG-S5]